MNLLDSIIAFLCAVLSALGMGGGGILLIYLTLFLGLEQQSAQGINLVFFIPIAAVAIFIHARNGLIKWKVTLKCVLPGFLGVYIGWKLAMALEPELLSKLFGGLLLIIGAREILSKPRVNRSEK